MTPVIGIDLGTTNSVIAYLTPEGRPESIPCTEGKAIVPSVIQFDEDGQYSIGELAKREIAFAPDRTAHFFKRDMGTEAVYRFGSREETPVTLSAMVLAKLKQDAETFLGAPISRAVITVPAYFHNAARLATQEAGRLAGLEVVQVINEPTAAALAYGIRPGQRNERLLVFDLGGGTFDVSIAEVGTDEIRILATDGNHQLGGKDWDDRLLGHLCAEFERRTGRDPLDDPHAFNDLLIRVEEAKKALTERDETTVTVQHEGLRERITISRATFQQLSEDLVAQLETVVLRALKHANLSPHAVDTILMVGGSTRMPACGALIQRIFGKSASHLINPDEAVAHGAALQASLASDGASPAHPRRRQHGLARIRDVMSHSLGMIAVNEAGDRFVNCILVPKNLPIPAREVRPFTVPASQETVSVYVTQGESNVPSDVSFVAKYRLTELSGIPGKPTILDIAYAYDASGVVHVEAVNRMSQQPVKVLAEPIPDDMSWLYGRPNRSDQAHKTILLAIDLSGSMGGIPLRDAQDAMRAFVQKSDLTRSSIGILIFSERSQLHLAPCQDAKLLYQSIDDLRINLDDLGYGTSARPFELALESLEKTRGLRFIVCLTDGLWDDERTAIQQAKSCLGSGIDLVAIGFGSANESFLRQIATSDEAAIYAKQNLVETFESIAQVLVETQETGLRVLRR